MTAQIVTCPGCNSRYQTSASPGQQLQCPKCQTMLVIPAPVAPSDPLGDPLGSLPADDLWSSSAEVPAAGFAPPNPLAGNVARRQQSRPRSQPKKGFSIDPDLKPFLVRLGIGIGIVCALILVTGIGGLFSEPVAIGSSIIGLIATVGLVAAALVWFVVIAFKENTVLGVATIFVPLLWSYCLAKNLRHSQLAIALLISALIPAVLTLAEAEFFKARYSTAGKSAARARQWAKNADNMVKLIREQEAREPPTGQPRAATYKFSMRLKEPARFLSEGERGLSQFSGYVKGSLALDETQNRMTFQHRGSDGLEQKYRLYLAFETNTFIGTRVTTQ